MKVSEQETMQGEHRMEFAGLLESLTLNSKPSGATCNVHEPEPIIVLQEYHDPQEQ